MKQLSLNTSQIIRAFPHHLFVNAIASSDSSTGENLAKITVESEDNSKWESQTRDSNIIISRKS